MKRIGILFGQERSFPPRSSSGSTAPAPTSSPSRSTIGGISLESPKRYDLILDRISQDIPFYRAILKKAVADGTIVVNNPFWWSADDKFFNNVVARRVGVAVPKTVILPSNQHPPDTTSESMSNLVFPLEWDEMFQHIGFPAYFKPYSGGGWKSVYRVDQPGRVLRGLPGLRPERHDAAGGDRLRRVLPLLRDRPQVRPHHAVRPAAAARQPLRPGRAADRTRRCTSASTATA